MALFQFNFFFFQFFSFILSWTVICSWILVCLSTMCFSNIICNIWLIYILMYNLCPEVIWRMCCVLSGSVWCKGSIHICVKSTPSKDTVHSFIFPRMNSKMLEVIPLSGETRTTKFKIETNDFCCWLVSWMCPSQMWFEGIPGFEGEGVFCLAHELTELI